MTYNQDAGARSGYGGEQSRFGFGRQGGGRNKKGLLGLQNLGNTCFMNAALQCMTHTHGLQKYFRTCSHAYTSKGQNSRQKLLMAFYNWFERDWGKNISANYHSPEDILRSVQQLNPVFQGYAQQDSQEFLRCVLDNMHEELRKEVPDDLQGHLKKSFGIEAQGDHSQLGSTSSSQSSRTEGPRSSSSSSQAVGGRSKTSPTSSARQFMQLCQSTEGVTDVGEIRLPEAPHPSSSHSSSAGDFISTGNAGDNDSEVSGLDSTQGSSSASTKTSKDPKKEEEEKTHFESIISEVFQGRVVSIVECMDCRATSKTHEVVYDVSVPIPNSNEISDGLGGAAKAAAGGLFGGLPGKVKGWFVDKGVDITDCLRKYSAPEFLTARDKVFCEKCKRKNDAEKRIVFKDLPEVLCVHIKRFRYDAGWFNGTKNSKVVTFPVNRPLDMSSHMDQVPPYPVEYQMVGLIQHIGSMGGGHYISYCRHKRKPQDWYEFDDMQVSLVSPEQVERAEPYVLFYQRMPSKGQKHERLTFKNDMRLVQSQIRAFLVNQSAGDNASQAAAQTAAEEMRHHGPALRNLYKKPPADLDLVFVSKHWYVRLTTLSDPGPLDNYMYLCPHQLLGSHSAEMAAEPFIPISRNLWQGLLKKYGGGPVVNSLELCTQCQTFIRAYNERKQAEFDLVSKYDTKDTGEGKNWYLVDALWVNKWKRYVRAEHVTDISDVSAPGPIDNARLFEKNTGRIRDKLKLRIDYIGVNARVWWLFMHVHGGGPGICREELDIYSKENNAEVELKLEELQGAEAVEFSRRISRQFVDECKGDLQTYNRKYGRKDENAMQVDSEEVQRASTDAMEDVGDDRGRRELQDLRGKMAAQIQEHETQIKALREDLQRGQSRQKALREAGATITTLRVADDSNALPDEPRGTDPEELLAFELHKAKLLQKKLDQQERDLLAEQQGWEERILAKEDELRRERILAAEDELRRKA